MKPCRKWLYRHGSASYVCREALQAPDAYPGRSDDAIGSRRDRELLMTSTQASWKPLLSRTAAGQLRARRRRGCVIFATARTPFVNNTTGVS
jgi:hypothetical protein